MLIVSIILEWYDHKEYEKRGVRNSSEKIHYKNLQHQQKPITKGIIYTCVAGMEAMKLGIYYELGKSIYETFFV